MNMKIERKRSARGMIVRLLIEDFGQFTTVQSLQKMLDRRGYALSMDELRFHVEYMAQQGLIATRVARDLPGYESDSSLAPDDVVMLKLSAKGVQLSNREISDPEVTF